MYSTREKEQKQKESHGSRANYTLRWYKNKKLHYFSSFSYFQTCVLNVTAEQCDHLQDPTSFTTYQPQEASPKLKLLKI